MSLEETVCNSEQRERKTLAHRILAVEVGKGPLFFWNFFMILSISCQTLLVGNGGHPRGHTLFPRFTLRGVALRRPFARFASNQRLIRVITVLQAVLAGYGPSHSLASNSDSDSNVLI